MKKLIFILMAVGVLIMPTIAEGQNQITRPKKQTEQMSGEKTSNQTSKKRNSSKDKEPQEENVIFPQLRTTYKHMDLELEAKKTNELYYASLEEYRALDFKQKILFNFNGLVIADGREEFVIALKTEKKLGKECDNIYETLPNLFQSWKILNNYSEIQQMASDIEGSFKFYPHPEIIMPKQKYPSILISGKMSNYPSLYVIKSQYKFLDTHPIKDTDKNNEYYIFPIIRTLKTMRLRTYDQREPFDFEILFHGNYYYISSKELDGLEEYEKKSLKRTGILCKVNGDEFILAPFGDGYVHTWNRSVQEYCNDENGRLPLKNQMEWISNNQEILIDYINSFFDTNTLNKYFEGKHFWSKDVESQDKKGNPITVWGLSDGKVIPLNVYVKKKEPNYQSVIKLYTPQTSKSTTL